MIEKHKINIAVAEEILDWLRGDEGLRASFPEPVVTLDDEGDLLFYNAACGVDENEIVICERLECDSFGDGWDSEDVKGEDFINYLNEIEADYDGPYYCEY